jgi:fructuronate reductase
MRYVSGVDDQGQAIEISDPLLPVIAQTVQNSADGEERARCWVLRLFSVPACPGEPFRQRGGARLFILQQHGAKATVAAWAQAN